MLVNHMTSLNNTTAGKTKGIEKLLNPFTCLFPFVLIHVHLIVVAVLSHNVTKVILPVARCSGVYFAEERATPFPPFLRQC